MEGAEAAWSAVGATVPLADLPKPTDIPPENPTTVTPHKITRDEVVVDLETYEDVMTELRSFADYLSEYSSDAVRATLGRAHDNLEEAAGTIRALTQEPDEVTLRRWRDVERNLESVAEGNVPLHMAREVAAHAAETITAMLHLIGGAR